MASTEDDVVVRLRLKDVAKFIADVKSGKLAIEDLEKKIQGASRTAARESSSGGGLGKLASHFGFLATWASRGALALGAATVGVAGYAVKSAASMEQVSVSMETMLGSASKAQTMMADLQKFARDTPFEFGDVAKQAQHMLAFGFAAKSVIPSLTAVGNAASGLGLGAEGMDRVVTALGQIKMKGRVQGDEMLQLAEAGINANAYLEKAFHLTPMQLQKAQQAGKISAAAAIPVILKGMDDQFKGLMGKQSQTLGGIWSNFHDAMEQGLVRLASPFLPAMKEWLQRLVDAAPQIEAFLSKVIGYTARGAQTAFDLGKTLFAKIEDIGGEAKAWAQGIIDQVQSALKDGNWSGVGQVVGGSIRNAITGVGGAVDKSASDTDWYDLGRNAVAGSVTFILGFVSAFFDPTVWWGILKAHWVDIGLLLVAVFTDGFGGAIGKLGGVLAKIPIVGRFLGWLLGSFQRLLSAVRGPIWGFVSHIGEAIGNAFVRVFPEAGTRIWYFFARIKEIFTEGIPGIGRTIGKWFADLPERMFTWMFRAIRRMGEAVKSGAENLFRPIAEKFQALLTWAGGKWSEFLGFIGIGGATGGAPDNGGDLSGGSGDSGVVPGLAGGGTVTSGGWTDVGERGRERLYLPRGSQVIPLPRAAGGGGGVAGQPLHVHVEVNGREIATAVLDDLNARAARR